MYTVNPWFLLCENQVNAEKVNSKDSEQWELEERAVQVSCYNPNTGTQLFHCSVLLSSPPHVPVHSCLNVASFFWQEKSLTQDLCSIRVCKMVSYINQAN